jgi:hypothetical protein
MPSIEVQQEIEVKAKVQCFSPIEGLAGELRMKKQTKRAIWRVGLI